MKKKTYRKIPPLSGIKGDESSWSLKEALKQEILHMYISTFSEKYKPLSEKAYSKL